MIQVLLWRCGRTIHPQESLNWMKTKRALGGRGCTADRRGRHCSARTPPADRLPPSRRRQTVGIDRRGDAKHLVWFDYLNSERSVRRVVRCRTVRTHYSRRRLSRINYSSTKMVQLVTDAVSIKLGTCNILVGTNIFVCDYFGYFGGAFNLLNNSTNNIVLSHVFDCALFTTIVVIFCAFRKIYCARRTERVFVLRTSTRSSSSSSLLLLYDHFIIIITCEPCEATARIRARRRCEDLTGWGEGLYLICPRPPTVMIEVFNLEMCACVCE